MAMVRPAKLPPPPPPPFVVFLFFSFFPFSFLFFFKRVERENTFLLSHFTVYLDQHFLCRMKTTTTNSHFPPGNHISTTHSSTRQMLVAAVHGLEEEEIMPIPVNKFVTSNHALSHKLLPTIRVPSTCLNSQSTLLQTVSNVSHSHNGKNSVIVAKPSAITHDLTKPSAWPIAGHVFPRVPVPSQLLRPRPRVTFRTAFAHQTSHTVSSLPKFPPSVLHQFPPASFSKDQAHKQSAAPTNSTV